MRIGGPYLKAFTLMECIVAMLLTAMLTGIIYLAFNFTGKRADQFTDQSRQIQEIALLDATLRKEVENAQLLQRTDHGFIIKSENTAIRYEFAENEIARIQEQRTDIFPIVAELSTSYQHVSNSEIIDRISISSEHNHFEYHKQYDAQTRAIIRRGGSNGN